MSKVTKGKPAPLIFALREMGEDHNSLRRGNAIDLAEEGTALPDTWVTARRAGSESLRAGKAGGSEDHGTIMAKSMAETFRYFGEHSETATH